jgi:hypothetical protein
MQDVEEEFNKDINLENIQIEILGKKFNNNKNIPLEILINRTEQVENRVLRIEDKV